MIPQENEFDLKEWDTLARTAADGGLLQSRVWAASQERLGRRVEYITLRTPDYSLRTLAVEHRLPIGFSYVYSPRGPIVENNELGMRNYGAVIDMLALEVKRRFPRAIFWRIEPPLPEFRIEDLGLRIVKAPHDVQPRTTLVIDLTKSEDELLTAMKQKTRYNIGVAERHGVSVRQSTNPEDLEKFLDLLNQTAQRDGFRAHPRSYYEKMLESRSLGSARDDRKGDRIALYVAECGDVILAAAIVAFFGRWSYYLHGASSAEHREVMAPYALHWEIMREAKRRGCLRYDLWGTDEQRWPGVTRFKAGFAPNIKPTSFTGTWDVVLRPRLYRVYRLLRR